MKARKEDDIINFFLEGHRKGVERAKELSIRTGVPLVIEKNGKIIEIPPKFKYILVPIEEEKKKKKPRKN